MILNIPSVSAQSVSYSLPSPEANFSCPIFSDNSKPSSFNFIFKSDQYLLGIVLSVKAPTTSTTEKNHLFSTNFLLTAFPLNKII